MELLAITSVTGTVSIHASTRGDTRERSQSTQPSRFNPRLHERRRDALQRLQVYAFQSARGGDLGSADGVVTTFQSTPPRGGDPSQHVILVDDLLFQSTPPRGRPQMARQLVS